MTPLPEPLAFLQTEELPCNGSTKPHADDEGKQSQPAPPEPEADAKVPPASPTEPDHPPAPELDGKGRWVVVLVVCLINSTFINLARIQTFLDQTFKIQQFASSLWPYAGTPSQCCQSAFDSMGQA